MIATQHSRQTKYCKEIAVIVKELGHASNTQILVELHKTYPTVSATTVHRATARLATRGELGSAPADPSGAMRYDANLLPHDHFVCGNCGVLKDVNIAEKVQSLLSESIKGCGVSGNVTITGTCKYCSVRGGL